MRRLGLLLVLLAGCARPAELVASGPKPCQGDADCNSGEVCLDIGCAAPDQNLVVEVVPPPTATNLARQEFANVDASRALALALGEPASMEVQSNLYPLQLSLRVTPLSLLDYPYSLPVAEVGAQTTLLLAPGSYRIRATPADGITPPIELATTLQSPGSRFNAALQFLPQGQLEHLQGFLDPRRLAAQPGPLRYALQLRKVDHTPLSQPVKTGQADAGPFAFALYLAPPTDLGATLELSASPVAGVGPTVTVSGTLSALQALVADGGLSLGESEPVQVQGEIDDAQGLPLPNATVRISADLPGSARYVSADTHTDAKGRYTLEGLHQPDGGGEAYKVLVVPPEGSGLAMVQQDAVSDWGSATFAPVRVPSLTRVTGRVLDADGKPTPGATVQATPVAKSTLPLVSASATAVDDGSFQLFLTPGTYHFDFSPPLALTAPSSARGPLPIDGEQTALPDLRFSAARIVSGTVTGPNGQGLEGALVRVYHVLAPGSSGRDGAGGRVRSTLLARGQVLSGGSFSVVLPAPPSHSK